MLWNYMYNGFAPSSRNFFPTDSSTLCKANFLNPGHHPLQKVLMPICKHFRLPQIQSVEESSLKNIVATVNHVWAGC